MTEEVTHERLVEAVDFLLKKVNSLARETARQKVEINNMRSSNKKLEERIAVSATLEKKLSNSLKTLSSDLLELKLENNYKESTLRRLSENCYAMSVSIEEIEGKLR